MSHTSTYTVSGMTCGHCVASVSEEVAEVDGVTGVDVDLESGRLTITSEEALDPERIRAAVAEAGYSLTES